MHCIYFKKEDALIVNHMIVRGVTLCVLAFIAKFLKILLVSQANGILRPLGTNAGTYRDQVRVVLNRGFFLYLKYFEELFYFDFGNEYF